MVYNILSCFGALKIVFLYYVYVVIVILLCVQVSGITLNDCTQICKNTPFHRYL